MMRAPPANIAAAIPDSRFLRRWRAQRKTFPLGVDLVLAGHSHGYERSFLVNGAYGNSADNRVKMSQIALDSKSGDPSTSDGPYRKKDSRSGNLGTVYVVAGSAGPLTIASEPGS